MQNTPHRAGPTLLTNAAANLLNPGTTTGGVNCTAAPFDKLYLLVKQIHVADLSGAGGTFSLYIGSTGGSANGTEIAEAVSVAANSVTDLYFQNLRLSQADFLTGLASANNTLAVTIISEIGIGA